MKKELTCIVCPIGCSLVAEVKDNGEVLVSGNTCPRGRVYAENECIAPVRTITTTVRCKSGELLPVKTSLPIPKKKMPAAMKIINRACPVLPITIGDVIIEDVFGSDIVAARNIP